MAQRIQVILIDDTTGGDATETVNFALDNVSYEIDLSAENAAQLRQDFDKWVGAGRRVSSRRGAASRARSNDSAKVRAWAKDNGFDVSERGRISAEIREAYSQAN